MIYFFTPYFKTGGPENSHQTCSIINQMCNKIVSKVIYTTNHPGDISLYPEIPHAAFGGLGEVEDLPTNFIVLPEIYPVHQVRQTTHIVNCQYIVWWQSFINACTNNALPNYDIKGIAHAFHSYYEYAMVRPHLKSGQLYFFLTDFIAETYTSVDSETLLESKKPIVCFNGHKDHMTKQLCQESNLPFLEIKDMERESVNEILAQCQVYVDMGFHPGKDHMPREAAMYGCVVITNKSGSAAYIEDVPIDEKVVLESELIPLIKTVLADYPSYYSKQEHYRNVIRKEKEVAEKNITNFLRIHNGLVSMYDGIVFVDGGVYTKTLEGCEPILKKLEEICIEKMGSSVVEGNCFCKNGDITTRLPELIPKQQNLFSLGITAKNILEIGFNAGHSALLFLMANKTSKIVCFDICHYPYARPCFDYLQSLFGDRLELVEGDSTVTVPDYCTKFTGHTFDVVHIDGSHDIQIARQDVENTLSVATDVVIFDDTQDASLNSLVDEYIAKGTVVEMTMRKTDTYEHRITRKLVNK